jgi:hypothetical protein
LRRLDSAGRDCSGIRRFPQELREWRRETITAASAASAPICSINIELPIRRAIVRTRATMAYSNNFVPLSACIRRRPQKKFAARAVDATKVDVFAIYISPKLRC